MNKTAIPKIALRIVLLCLMFCMASVFRMRKLTIYSMGWGEILAEYQLDFADGFAEVDYFDFDGTPASHAEGIFSAEQQREIRFVCFVSFMPLWRNSYIDSSVADGDQWQITLTYDKMEKTIYGSNAYPLMYDFAWKRIRAVFHTLK